jgi:hypothetical protein
MEISEETNGLISWSETAGLKQLIRKGPFDKNFKYQFLPQDYDLNSNNIEAA